MADDVTNRALERAREIGCEDRNDGLSGLVAAAVGLAAGAAGMYFFDPELGRGRRTAFLDRLGETARRRAETAGGRGLDLRQRLAGARAEARYRTSDEAVPDDVLVERVRAELGHHVRHAGAVTVEASGGAVVLSGPLLADEAPAALAAAGTVPGVREVVNRIDVRQEAGAIPSLQG